MFETSFLDVDVVALELVLRVHVCNELDSRRQVPAHATDKYAPEKCVDATLSAAGNLVGFADLPAEQD